MRACWVVALAACGSTPPPPPPPPPIVHHVAAGPSQADLEVQRERERHRAIETEQQDALGTSCSEPPPHDKHPRCEPSCYPTEQPDPRAGTKLHGLTAIEHVVCQRDGGYLLADETAKLASRPARKLPPPPKKGSWQADVAKWLDAKHPVAVTGTWRDTVQPLTGEHLQCVRVFEYGRAVDPCGIAGGCEASGNAAARGINVVHYRLAEARKLQSQHKLDDCQRAALEAIAVARGMPRWRQYAKLNVEQWQNVAAYRTRFDGTLDEDALFETAASLGRDAEGVYAACGGTAATTTPAQEQSFHDCW